MADRASLYFSKHIRSTKESLSKALWKEVAELAKTPWPWTIAAWPAAMYARTASALQP